MDDRSFLNTETSFDESGSYNSSNSPFTNDLFVSPEEEAVSLPGEMNYEIPFISSYTTAQNEDENADPRRQQLVQMLDEIQDDEFATGIVDLANEAELVLEQQFALNSTPNAHVWQQQTEMLNSHFHPLVIQAEQFLNQLAQEFNRHHDEDFTNHYIDQTINKTMVNFEHANPVFEQFFGKLVRKIKKVAKKVVRVAKKGIRFAKKFSPVHIVMGRIKKMIRPMISKIIAKVVNRLPRALRTPAKFLARKLGLHIGRELSAMELAEHELALQEVFETELMTYEVEAAGPDYSLLAQEIDQSLVLQLFAGSEADASIAFEQFSNEKTDMDDREAIQRLEIAREQLISAIQRAQTAEEVGPEVEQFIGAALTVLRWGIRIMGRKRVVKFVTKLFTKLISKLIGKKTAAPLAKVLVNYGFKLLNLEVSAGEEDREAAATIVQTLEDLVGEVVTFDNEILEDEEALEQEAYTRFMKIVAKNLPSPMINGELRESEQSGAWVLRPARGRRKYKKYSRVLEISLNKDKLKGLRTFGGESILAFFRNRYGITLSKPINVRVHVFQAVRGTTLSYISLKEKRVKGLGSARQSAWSQIHPLTPTMAGQLLGNRMLGTRVGRKWLHSRHRIRNGQRFFFLEFPGQMQDTGATVPATRGIVPVVGHVLKNEAMVKLDFTRATMTLALTMTEDRAAEMARRVRANDFLGAAITFRTSIRDALNNILLKHIGRQVKIVMETSPDLYFEEYLGGIMSQAGKIAGRAAVEALKKVIQILLKRLVELAIKAIANHLRRLKNDFLAAQESPKQGVSLHLDFVDMPGMAQLKLYFKVKKGEPLSLGDFVNAIPSIPLPDLKIYPGRKNL